MQSPYKTTSGTSIGLQNQIIALFRLEGTTKEAFIDLVSSCNDPETDFNEEYDSIISFNKLEPEEAQKLFHAYEALYSLVQAKVATERAMKDGNSAVIKTQLEEIAKYAFEVENAPKELMALTETQKEHLTTYLEKLKEYERVFSIENE